MDVESGWPRRLAAPRKIGVVGCGALGGFYAARLVRAGWPVHCLVRSDYEVVRREGFRVESVEGDFVARPEVAARPEAVGECDAVLIGLKTTANGAFSELLSPLVGRETVLVTLQNGLGNEEALAELFGEERVLGGLCFVCLNRVGPGRIVHRAHGRIVLGEHGRAPQARTHTVAGWFRSAGVACDVTESLARAHWEKLVWNIPFNGLGVAGVAGYEALALGRLDPERGLGRCLSTQDLLGEARWEAAVRELMLEVMRTAWALGHAVDPAWAEVQIERTRLMGDYRASTLVDFERGQALELESLFRLPLARARQAGVEAPWMERLCAVLEALDRRTSGG